MKRHYPEIGLHVPTLLLPRADVPLASWSVVACDQYTSQPEYWEETGRLVGDRPSTLHLILPEAQLGRGDRDEAIAAINDRMVDYLASGVLEPQPPGFMLVERGLGRSVPRRGLVVALDLEAFDYRPGARELIRSTEGTDRNRLPARIAVRRDAAVEAPHIMVLIDDPRRTVIEPLFQHDLACAYDFELMQGGGRLRAWRVDDAAMIDGVVGRLAALRAGEPPLIYAMGDGNHSFAAAKAVWEEIRANVPADHPGRYALVELVNVHDDALDFEPIHRLVEGVSPEDVLAAMAAHGFRRRALPGREAWEASRKQPGLGHRIPYVAGQEFGVLEMDAPGRLLPTATLHHFLDAFLDRTDAGIDYIHGDDVLLELGAEERRIGFLLPAMDKNDLFRTVIEDGATPRKTFSLGEPHEKRYYLECRRIR